MVLRPVEENIVLLLPGIGAACRVPMPCSILVPATSAPIAGWLLRLRLLNGSLVRAVDGRAIVLLRQARGPVPRMLGLGQNSLLLLIAGAFERVGCDQAIQAVGDDVTPGMHPIVHLIPVDARVLVWQDQAHASCL